MVAVLENAVNNAVTITATATATLGGNAALGQHDTLVVVCATPNLIQIHAKAPVPEHGPDHGYSSWLVLPDGRIRFVDYTNCGDPVNKSHLVGAYLTAEDGQ